MRRALAGTAAAIVAHEALIAIADRAGLIERLLAPGPAALAALPLAVLLYALRLYVLFVLPARLLLALRSRRPRRGG